MVILKLEPPWKEKQRQAGFYLSQYEDECDLFSH